MSIEAALGNAGIDAWKIARRLPFDPAINSRRSTPLWVWLSVALLAIGAVTYLTTVYFVKHPGLACGSGSAGQSSGSTLTMEAPSIAAHPEAHRRRRIVDEDPADIGRARQQIIDHFARFGIQPRHLVGHHRSGPGVLVPVEHDIVGRRPARVEFPFLELLWFSCRTSRSGRRDIRRTRADPAHPCCRAAAPSAALVSGNSATSPRLGVDAADLALTEIGEKDVVLASPGSRRRCCAARPCGALLNGIQVSILPVAMIEAVHAGKAVVLGPDLAVDMRTAAGSPC